MSRDLVIVASSLISAPHLYRGSVEEAGLRCEITPPHVEGALEVVRNNLETVGLVAVDPNLPLDGSSEDLTPDGGLRVLEGLRRAASLVRPEHQDAVLETPFVPISSATWNQQFMREVVARGHPILLPESPAEEVILYLQPTKVVAAAAKKYAQRLADNT